MNTVSRARNVAEAAHVAYRGEAPDPAAEARAVLSRAVVRAARLLDLTQARVARMLGLSEATASRLFAGRYVLDPSRKEWELAAAFVRLHRALDALVGSNDTTARAWLHGPNTALGVAPIERLATIDGLFETVAYLDAHRGRL
jgi:DNA-directed RNA polymerase specialized sigma24 family protein